MLYFFKYIIYFAYSPEQSYQALLLDIFLHHALIDQTVLNKTNPMHENIFGL